MSKILYPSPRLGFLVAPPQLVDTLVKVRVAMDQHSPAIDQATLARFITEGFFLSHVKRIRELYAQRRVFLSNNSKIGWVNTSNSKPRRLVCISSPR